MIDRQTILAQMEALSAQRQQHEGDIKAIDGAMQLCRHWLNKCDEQDAANRVESNGQEETAATANAN